MRIFTLAFLVTLAAPAYSSVVLLTPTEPATAGQAARFTLLVTNDTAQPWAYTPPATLALKLKTGTGSADLNLTAGVTSGNTTPIPVGGFRKFQYQGTLPPGVYGTVMVQAPDVAENQTALEIAAQKTQDNTAQVPKVAVKTAGASAVDDFQQKVTQAASAYEPVYFEVGTRDYTNAKFQLSFKYRFATPDDGAAPKFYERIYFGYTQMSIWNLQAASKPFEDSVYKPSLFYYNDNLFSTAGNGTGVGLETGLGHESNGRAGPDSRSINLAYIRPIVRLGDALDWHWTIAPKLYDYLEKDENPDIQRYRGYADVLVKFGKPRGWEFAALLRKGTRGSYGSLDASASYPLEYLPFGNLNGYIVLDYFTGYGEDLINYNQRMTSQLRLGLMIVR